MFDNIDNGTLVLCSVAAFIIAIFFVGWLMNRNDGKPNVKESKKNE